MSVILIYGNDEYLIKHNKLQTINKYVESTDTMNLSIFDESFNVESIMNIATTLPFLNEYRVVVLACSGYLKKCPDKFDLNKIPDSTKLILIEKDVDMRSRCYKWIKENGEIITCNTPSFDKLKQWGQSYVEKKGKSISQDAINYLLEYVVTDMYTLKNELDKVISYQSEHHISINDIKQTSSSLVIDKMFEMLDCISEKNASKSFLLYQDLLILKESPVKILHMINRHFNILMRVKGLSGKENKEIASVCAIPPFSVKKYKDISGRFTQEQLYCYVKECNDMDFAIKTGKFPDKIAVEQLIVRLLQ